MLKKEKSLKVEIYQSKMPISRQVRYYKQSRDNWKKKATKKQKKLREYVYQNRALTQSRDNWKEKAKEAGKRVKELEREVEKLKQMKILSQSISLETPHYSSIRSWLARLGLYELKIIATRL